MPLAPPQVGTSFAYYLAAAISHYLTRGQDGIAMVWRASGILLATLLVVKGQHAGWFPATAIWRALARTLKPKMQ